MAILDFGTTAYELYGDTVVGVSTVTNNIAEYCSEGFRTSHASLTSNLEWTSDETEVWFTWYYYSNEASAISGTYMQFLDENDNPIIRLWKENGVANGLHFQYWDGSAWNDIAADFNENVDVARRLDFGVVMNGTTGAVYMYKDRGLYASQENFDTTNSAARSFCKKIEIGGNQNSGYVYYSGLVAANENTLNFFYVQTKPAADGNYTDWNGDYTDIDEVGMDDTDVLYAQTNGAQSTFTQTSLDPSFTDTAWDIKALGTSAQVFNGSVRALPNIQMLTRSGTTDATGDLESITVAKKGVKHLFDVDPATGVEWTVTDVAAAETGVKLSS